MMTDFRYAVRVLAKQPGFTAAAVLTLAAGIGLNSALFGIFNALLLKPMPVADPARLVWIASASLKPSGPQGNLTYPDFLAIRDRRDVFSDAFAFTEAAMSVSAAGQALRVDGQVVSGNMFEVLGVRMHQGRAFAADEDRTPGAHPVAVIGYGLVQRLFANGTSAIGRTIAINGRPFTIVGVAPQGFVGPELMAPADVWVPLMMSAAVLPDVRAPFSAGSWWLKAVGRRAPGASIAAARAVAAGVAKAIEQAEPSSHAGVTLRVERFHGTDPRNREQMLPLSGLLLGLTMSVLLIACANVAGLLLSRAAGRQREVGIRLAVGATRRILVRQFLAESLLLALLAGVSGLLLGMWGTELIVATVDIPMRVNAAPDWRVATFTLVIALVAGIAFGLTPALRSARQDVLAALRGDRPDGGLPRPSRLQRSLIVGQLALALVLLVGAGLFVRSLAQAWKTDVGFEYAGRVAVTVDVRLQNYAAPRALAFYSQLVERVRAVPGVEDATLAHAIPFGGRVFVHGLSFPGQAADPERRPERASVNRVWTNFFSTLRIPIVRGRDFAASDLKAAPDVAIISETMAEKFWPDRDPIGQRFSIGPSAGPYLTVVGVARAGLIDEFTERPWAVVYVPHDTMPAEVALIAASAAPAAETLRAIERTVHALDPELAIIAARPLSAYVAERLDGERAMSSLLAVCGSLALVLAALGLYGVMGYAVTRRTREIGVRIALGAAAHDVRRLFVGDALRVAAWGVAWGMLPAVAVTYALRGALVGVGVADPPTLIASAAVLVASTVAAAYVPARRATRVDPMVALRAE